MPTDPIGRLTERFDVFIRAACEARFEGDDRFVRLRSEEFERYVVEERSRLGATLPGKFAGSEVEPIVFLPSGQVDSPRPYRSLPLPDPVYPAALPPRQSTPAPDYQESPVSLRLVGNVLALLVAGAAILAVCRAFDSIPSPFAQGPCFESGELEDPAIKLTIEADRQRQVVRDRERRVARDRDVESILANWPDELNNYRTSARRIYAHMFAGESGETMVLDLGDGRYRAERNDAGELRIFESADEIPGAATADDTP